MAASLRLEERKGNELNGKLKKKQSLSADSPVGCSYLKPLQVAHN